MDICADVTLTASLTIKWVTSIDCGQCVIHSGESVTITVCAEEEDTMALLAKVLDGDQTAASLLTKAIHQKLQLRDEKAESLQLSLIPEDVAIWIDPIGKTQCPFFDLLLSLVCLQYWLIVYRVETTSQDGSSSHWFRSTSGFRV